MQIAVPSAGGLGDMVGRLMVTEGSIQSFFVATGLMVFDSAVLLLRLYSIPVVDVDIFLVCRCPVSLDRIVVVVAIMSLSLFLTHFSHIEQIQIDLRSRLSRS